MKRKWKKRQGENTGKGARREKSGGRDDMRKKGKVCVRRRVEKSCKKRQKFKKFHWRPSSKQRGLFSDSEPSQETQLENRLNRLC